MDHARRPFASLAALTVGLGLAACGTSADDVTEAPDGGAPVAPDTTITAAPAAFTNQALARFEFHADVADATFRCTIVGQPPATCTSPLELTLPDGEHELVVTALSPAGIGDPTPARHTWTIDTTPPRTTFVRVPAALDNSANAVFEFRAVGETVTFACHLDEGVVAPCTSPHTTAALTDGPHVLRVQATDRAGNVEAAPIEHRWTVDQSPPDTTIDSGPPTSSTSRDATFRFSSPDAGPGATYSCQLGGVAGWSACVSPHTVTALADGAHWFAVQVRDVNGVADPTPAMQTWTIDATAPTLTITSGPSAATSDNTPTFSFGATGATAVECRLVGATTPDFAPCASPYTAATLPEGAARFELRARDAFANEAVADRAFLVDTIAPTVEVTAGPTGPVAVLHPVFEFTAAADAVTTTCRVDNLTATNCTSPFTVTNLLPEGVHSFTVRVTDAAGNSATASRWFTIDFTAPTITFTSGLPSGAVTSSPTQTFAFWASEGATLCRVDGGAFAACASPFTTAVLATGNHTFSVRAADTAGNIGVGSRTFTVDTRPLAVVFTGGPTGPTSVRRPTFTWTSTGAVQDTACRYDAAAFTTCYIADDETLADGPHTFAVRVYDDAGHTFTATQSFTVDTVAPSAAFTAGPSGTITDPAVSFAFTTSGDPSLTECRLYRQGSPTGAYAPCASPYATVLAPPSTPYPYVFEVRVHDEAGNVWSAYRAFTFATP